MEVDRRYMLLDDNLVPLARMKITDRHRQNDDSDLRSIYLFKKEIIIIIRKKEEKFQRC